MIALLLRLFGAGHRRNILVLKVHVVRGDPTQPHILRRAQPQSAQHALSTGASDGDVLVSAVLLRKLAPDVPVAALVSSPSVRDALRELGIHQTLSGPELIARTLAKTLETPHAGDMLAQLVEGNSEAAGDRLLVAGPVRERVQ